MEVTDVSTRLEQAERLTLLWRRRAKQLGRRLARAQFEVRRWRAGWIAEREQREKTERALWAAVDESARQRARAYATRANANLARERTEWRLAALRLFVLFLISVALTAVTVFVGFCLP